MFIVSKKTYPYLIFLICLENTPFFLILAVFDTFDTCLLEKKTPFFRVFVLEHDIHLWIQVAPQAIFLAIVLHLAVLAWWGILKWCIFQAK